MIIRISSTELKGLHTRPLKSAILSECGSWDGCCILRAGSNALEPNASEYIPLEPVLKIYADDHGSYVRSAKGLLQRFAGVWDGLEWLGNALAPTGEASGLPISAGYLSYDIARHLEDLPRPENDPYHIPLYLFYTYRRVLRLDTSLDTVQQIDVDFREDYEPFWRFDLRHLPPVQHESPDYSIKDEVSIDGLKSDLLHSANLSKSDYTRHVSEALSLIARGDIYQVNLTQRYTLPINTSAAQFFGTLDSLTPGRFGGFLNCQAVNGFPSFAIASASPELFLYSNGKQLLTSPIKGSRARDTGEEGEKRELLESAKDRAELAMIVDLERNDLGRVAQAGSVKVLSEAHIDSLEYVHHLVSDITAVRDEKHDIISVLKALFPSGSISGAPKIAAMKTIAQMENSMRGVYTGAFGYLGGGNSCHFNVAIRTALISGSKLSFNTGSGIVFDSDIEREYEECLFKARGIYKAWRSQAVSDKQSM